MAHIGGLVTGLVIGVLFAPSRVPTLRSLWVRPGPTPGTTVPAFGTGGNRRDPRRGSAAHGCRVRRPVDDGRRRLGVACSRCSTAGGRGSPRAGRRWRSSRRRSARVRAGRARKAIETWWPRSCASQARRRPRPRDRRRRPLGRPRVRRCCGPSPTRTRAPTGHLVRGWLTTSALTDRVVAQVIPGPYSLGLRVHGGAEAADRHEFTLELAARLGRGARRPRRGRLRDGRDRGARSPSRSATDPAERALFAARRRACSRTRPALHAMLAITGGSAWEAGADTILGAPFQSYLFDLVAGPDNWHLVRAVPGDRGVVCGGAASRQRRRPGARARVGGALRGILERSRPRTRRPDQRRVPRRPRPADDCRRAADALVRAAYLAHAAPRPGRRRGPRPPDHRAAVGPAVEAPQALVLTGAGSETHPMSRRAVSHAADRPQYRTRDAVRRSGWAFPTHRSSFGPDRDPASSPPSSEARRSVGVVDIGGLPDARVKRGWLQGQRLPPRQVGDDERRPLRRR